MREKSCLEKGKMHSGEVRISNLSVSMLLLPYQCSSSIYCFNKFYLQLKPNAVKFYCNRTHLFVHKDMLYLYSFYLYVYVVTETRV